MVPNLRWLPCALGRRVSSTLPLCNMLHDQRLCKVCVRTSSTLSLVEVNRCLPILKKSCSGNVWIHCPASPPPLSFMGLFQMEFRKLNMWEKMAFPQSQWDSCLALCIWNVLWIDSWFKTCTGLYRFLSIGFPLFKAGIKEKTAHFPDVKPFLISWRASSFWAIAESSMTPNSIKFDHFILSQSWGIPLPS